MVIRAVQGEDRQEIAMCGTATIHAVLVGPTFVYEMNVLHECSTCCPISCPCTCSSATLPNQACVDVPSSFCTRLT